MQVRLATPDDATAVLDIYAPIVRDTAISFEEEPPTLAQMRSRIEETLLTYPWLVALHDSEDARGISGYACATQHRARSGYRWSVEVSVYVAENARDRGVGRALYEELFRMLSMQGFHQAFAGVSIPNEASMALHRRCGFVPIGIYRGVGYKLGKWRDTFWWQRSLARPDDPPQQIAPITAL